MSNINKKIQSIVKDFYKSNSEYLKAQANTLAEELAELVAQGGTAPKAPKGAIPGSKVKSAAKSAAPRVKRDPAQLEKLKLDFVDYVTKNPGQRMEAISKALGLTTKDLQLPVKQLVEAKTVKTKGERRATAYFTKE